MTEYVDPNNIGWVGCIYLNIQKREILLVRSLEQETQIQKRVRELQGKLRKPKAELERTAYDQLNSENALKKPDFWGLPAGKIAWWKNNEELQKEFVAMKRLHARKQFILGIGERVLNNQQLLLNAAVGSAHYEFPEEASGLMIKSCSIVLEKSRFNREHRARPYPCFWFLVEEAMKDETWRPRRVKNTTSPPRWISLYDLRHPSSVPFKPRFRHHIGFPFFPGQIPGLLKALKRTAYKIDRDYHNIVDRLKSEFCSSGQQTQETEKPLWSKEESWEDIFNDPTIQRLQQ